MSISVVAFLLIGISLLLSMRIGLLAAGGLLLPFGMTAAISAGGASFNVFDVYFLSVGALYFARHATTKMPRAFVLPIAFAVLCVITAVVMPRLFSGMWVFPVNGLKDGNRISSVFTSTITPLRPSSGNVSQSVYVIFGMFYLMLFASIARKTPQKIHRLFVVAAISNLIVSAAFMLIGPEALEPFRTADYRTLDNASVLGIRRLIGGFPEASRYADFTAPLGVYFIAHYTASGRIMSLYLGLVTTACAILALSSTGFVAVGMAAIYAVSISMRRKGRSRRMLLMVSPIILAIFVITVATPGLVADVLNRLIFDKGDSISGLERGAWLANGWQTAVQTYFLGAGAGSVRSNGLLFVLLSNVGVIGTVVFFIIVWRALMRPSDTPIMVGLAVALVAAVSSRMVSQATIEPGIMFAMLIGARTQLETSRVHDAIKRKRRKIVIRHV